MANTYYETVSKLEEMGADSEYIQGWVGGYLHNPEREEQRVTEAYSAGFEDGKKRTTDSVDKWKN
ncbi:MAG: hypothetical protein U9Q71_09130 [Pseudomonadota bacterium]|nr:hypothetical protein [Pseudomonadota bacterium]